MVFKGAALVIGPGAPVVVTAPGVLDLEIELAGGAAFVERAALPRDGDGLGDARGPAQAREPGGGSPCGEARPGPVAAEERRTLDPCARRHLSAYRPANATKVPAPHPRRTPPLTPRTPATAPAPCPGPRARCGSPAARASAPSPGRSPAAESPTRGRR